MRLAWILLVALAAVHAAGLWEGSTSPATSTDAPDVTTPAATPAAVDTTTGGSEKPVESNTASTVSGATEEPAVTEKPETTDESETDGTEPTGQSPKTTKAVPTTTTTKKAAGTTTTKEPAPDVESFTVTCDKNEPAMCTYKMQVPGLDIETYNKLIGETNDTQSVVDDFEANDFVNLQEGVTKVFDDAEVTNDYISDQLKQITDAINALDVAANDLENDIMDVSDALLNANYSLTKILNKKGSCLYRQCILKEKTTPKPTTTTTVRTTPTPFCEVPANKDVCANDGECNTWYDSYYCTCSGNLDGQDEACKTSVCDVIKTSQLPGLVVSPGYLMNGSNFADEYGCDQAQWIIKANVSTSTLWLGESKGDWTSKDYISKLAPDANLQLTVGKYKLKITQKTKWDQITQILSYGPQATLAYSTSTQASFFHFTIVEVPAPVTTKAPAGDGS